MRKQKWVRTTQRRVPIIILDCDIGIVGLCIYFGTRVPRLNFKRKVWSVCVCRLRGICFDIFIFNYVTVMV